MKVNSSIFNSYTGIIKDIQLVQTNIDDYYLIKSITTDRVKFDKKYLFDGVGAGCSKTFENALLSSIGEVIERYCGNIPSNMITSTMEDLDKKGIVALDYNSFVNFPKENLQDPTFPFSKYSKKEEIYWSKSKNLFNGQEIYVPSTMVYVNLDNPNGKSYNFPNLSGLACGTDYNSAVQSALLETIERDASLRWWYDKTEERLVERVEESKLTFLSYQIDSVIPTIASFLFDFQNELVSVGFSTRFSIKEAIEKAKAEAVQLNFNMRNMLNNQLDLSDPVRKYLKPYKTDRKYIDSFRKDKKDMFDLIHNLQYYLDPRAFQEQKYRLNDKIKKGVTSPVNNLEELIAFLKSSGNSNLIVTDMTSSDISKVGYFVVRVLNSGSYINTPTAYLPVSREKISNFPPIPHS